MFRFLESICFRSDVYQLLDYHQVRVDQTFRHFYPDKTPPKLNEIMPELSGNEKIKVRLTYNEHDHAISVSKYLPKNISKLRLVYSDTLDYSFKYLDRSMLNQLLNPAQENEEVIIVKDGVVTDSSYANLVFRQGNAWYTPSSYLLNGVKRQHLLHQEAIFERVIRPEDINKYSEMSLINAMLDPGNISLPVDKIIR
ncbi:MAG: aminotransferase class IV [Cyclobacteriaceae bacterium]